MVTGMAFSQLKLRQTRLSHFELNIKLNCGITLSGFQTAKFKMTLESAKIKNMYTHKTISSILITT